MILRSTTIYPHSSRLRCVAPKGGINVQTETWENMATKDTQVLLTVPKQICRAQMEWKAN